MNILEFFGSMPSSYVDYLHIFNGMKSEKRTIKGSCTTYHGLNVYFFWISAGPIEACRQCKLQWRIYWSNRAHILFYCTIFVLSAHSADHLKGIYWNKQSISYSGMAECNYSIALDESKGRVLVAKKSIPQGELILHEKPLGKK